MAGRPRLFDSVLCDVDGVLRLWAPKTLPSLDRAYGLPPGTLAAAAFRPERLLSAVTGRITDEQWHAAVAEDLTAACGTAQRSRALVGAWSALTGEVNEEVLALLTAARRRRIPNAPGCPLPAACSSTTAQVTSRQPARWACGSCTTAGPPTCATP